MRFPFRAARSHSYSIDSTESPAAITFVEPLETRTLLSAGALVAAHHTAATASPAITLSPYATGGSSSNSAKRDAKFLQQESVDNNSEIALANLALTTSSNPDVIALANRLLTDHTAAQQQLEQIAATNGVTLQTTDKKHTSEANRLGNLSGRKFDVAFCSFEVGDHEKGIKRNQTEASRTQDASIQTYATAQVPVLQQHLALAQTALTSSKAESKTA